MNIKKVFIGGIVAIGTCQLLVTAFNVAGDLLSEKPSLKPNTVYSAGSSLKKSEKTLEEMFSELDEKEGFGVGRGNSETDRVTRKPRDSMSLEPQ